MAVPDEHPGPLRRFRVFDVSEHWRIPFLFGNGVRFVYGSSGPAEAENHWFRSLKPGEIFTTVPAAVAPAANFEEAVERMTAYRRAVRRRNEDDEKLPVKSAMRCTSGSV